MITSIEALKGLYVALGGELSDVASLNKIPDMLEAISTVASAAASELPAVKDADNGKVLTVVSGKWAKADLPAELPAVASEDNGKVLKVIEGEWGAASLPASGYSETTLAEGRIEGGIPKTLSDSITNYDAFYFVAPDSEGRNLVSPIMPVNNIDYGATQWVEFGLKDSTQPTSHRDTPFVFTDANTFEVEIDGYLTKIVGIKF